MASVYLSMRFWRRRQLAEDRIRRRNLRDISNPLNIPPSLFKEQYRLTQDLFIYLCDKVRPHTPTARRSTKTPLELKVLTTLSFLASGSYQKSIGADWNACFSQKTVSIHINEIVSAINVIMPEFIKFPSTRMERDKVKQGFRNKFGFPGVIGCIDGTHVKLIRPSVHEEIYFNRKGFHSINATVICDSDLKVIAINAKFGGSAHDSFVWRMMSLRAHVESIFNSRETTWLLGDSAYPLRPWLMTPLPHAIEGTPERAYTDLHCKVRNTVERCIGVMKARWRCVIGERGLHYSPDMCTKIINSCAVLHNICTDARLEVSEGNDADHSLFVADTLSEVYTESEADLLSHGRRVQATLISRLLQDQ